MQTGTKPLGSQKTLKRIAFMLVVGMLMVFGIVMPLVTTFRDGSKATLTIVSDKEMPFKFVLENERGSPSGPLTLDCRIDVKDGKGRFITGNIEDMDYFGSPPSYLTRFSRKLIVEIVDLKGKLVKREESVLGHVIYVGFEDDHTAKDGKKYFVKVPPP